MQDASHGSLWGWLAALVGAVFGVGGLAGWLLNRRKVPADITLITAQAEVETATAAKIRAEAGGTLVEAGGTLLDRMAAYCDRIEARLREEHIEVIRLEAALRERDSQIELLDEQLRREAAFREAKGLRLTD